MSNFILRVLQGTLIGLGAVLPGISGGVLCVVFGVYTILMEFLADPFRKLKSHFPRLLPIVIGVVCLFIGLIAGMLPSLYREAGEQGRNKKSYISLVIAMVVVFALLISLKVLQVEITPNFVWYIFCGACLALSIIAPGMSFSTTLMPLGLYEPFVAGIGDFDFGGLIPGGSGGLAAGM